MPYSLLLSPKGRIVTDLRVARVGDGASGALLLDLPSAGVAGATDHFSRYLPPRLAKLTPRPELGVVSVVGPNATTRIAEAIGLSAPALGESIEGDEWIVGSGIDALRVVRSGDVLPPAFDLIAPDDRRQSLERDLVAMGVAPADEAHWEVLRIEKGRPAFGVELDEDTLPPEAGLDRRGIDHAKGCYTGQEVIVRIRDRGHVNRQLRGLWWGGSAEASSGASQAVPRQGVARLRGIRLFDAEGKDVGELRSAARSPRFGETIGLAFVRREVQPPTQVRIGSEGGPIARLRALDDDGWVLVEGDAPLYP